jgi:hypothetical protein
VDIIRWWITVGAPSGVAIGTLEVPPDVRDKLTAELGVAF